MRLAAVATAGLALGVMGCGGNGGRVGYDRSSVQRYLASEVARTSPDLVVGAVTCPDRLPRGVGASTACAVVIDGVTTSYLVQVLAGERLEARPEYPVVDLRKIAAQIVEKAGQGTTATCGTVVVVQMTPGQRVVCAITSKDKQRRAVDTADPDGTVRVADLKS